LGKPRVLAVGFSHLGAIARGYGKLLAGGNSPLEMEFLFIEPHGQHRPVWQRVDDRWVYNRKIREEMENIIADFAPGLICASLWSNHHFVNSITPGPLPFTFYLPEERPSIEEVENVQVIAYDLICRSLMERVSPHVDMIDFFREFTSLDIVSPAAPPPLHRLHAVPNPPEGLEDAIRQYGVSPPALRLRLWRACESLFSDDAERRNYHFLAVPQLGVDEHGFRRHDHIVPTDWIHASDSYGELVVNQIADYLAEN
jgi:hypothetical protein